MARGEIALRELQTPALLIRLDRVRHNIGRMAEHVRGDLRRWRPHVKTSKIPEVFDLLIAAGVRRFKCATTREMHTLLARTDEPLDLLVAFPHRGPNLSRVAAIKADRPMHKVSIITEDADHAAEVRDRDDRLGLFVDLDPGYHRTGIPLADRARVEATVNAAGPALAGLHYYDGHLHDGTLEQRSGQCDQIYADLLSLARDLGLDGLELITSGTPTFPAALGHAGFADADHTVSPGTVVYSDVRTEECGITGFARAAHVLARVVSAPHADRVTCDAGSKALDAAAGDPCAVVEGWPGLVAQTPSEEHLPLRVESGDAPAPGTLVELAPRHVCPTVNLADEAVLMEGDRIIDIVPVLARGHETVG